MKKYLAAAGAALLSITISGTMLFGCARQNPGDTKPTAGPSGTDKPVPTASPAPEFTPEPTAETVTAPEITFLKNLIANKKITITDDNTYNVYLFKTEDSSDNIRCEYNINSDFYTLSGGSSSMAAFVKDGKAYLYSSESGIVYCDITSGQTDSFKTQIQKKISTFSDVVSTFVKPALSRNATVNFDGVTEDGKGYAYSCPTFGALRSCMFIVDTANEKLSSVHLTSDVTVCSSLIRIVGSDELASEIDNYVKSAQGGTKLDFESFMQKLNNTISFFDTTNYGLVQAGC